MNSGEVLLRNIREHPDDLVQRGEEALLWAWLMVAGIDP